MPNYIAKVRRPFINKNGEEKIQNKNVRILSPCITDAEREILNSIKPDGEILEIRRDWAIDD